jgi:curved DNA-binding protein
MTYKDYYQTLGVSKSASHDEIRKAFRKLARQHHPDVAKDKKSAENKFKEINEAYEVLGDPAKRKKYDELGADWERGGARQPPPGWGMGGAGKSGMGGGDFHFGGTGFSDFFEQFFSGGASRGGGRGQAGPFGGFGGFGGGTGVEQSRGDDVEADLLVTIEEALHGAKKKISFRRDGKSKVETYEVKIPKGVREGQKIRLAGQGGEGSHASMAGDFYLRVRFAQHPEYDVEGNDLIHELEIPAWQAVLGTEAAVPTPDGPARLKIPAGTQPGRKFRMKGRGLPIGASGRGDFYVLVQVALPEKLTDEERAHWEALSKLEK